jgi:hypothetical protein
LRGRGGVEKLRKGAGAETMRVEISDPVLLSAFVDFLTRAELTAVAVLPDVVDITAPAGLEPFQARRELGLYVLAWQAMNPHATLVALD